MYESSTKETKWVCIQLACSRRPRALEEAHCWNIQAKFYNEKFPLVYESDKTKDSLSWRSWCYFEAQVWQRIVTLSLLSFSLIFLGLLFFMAFLSFFIPHLGQCSRKWWSSHFYLFTTQWLQLDTRTKMTLYECLRWCTGICNEPRVTCMKELWMVALPQIRCQLHDHAKQYDNDERVMINGTVESCMAMYLGMAMEMP